MDEGDPTRKCKRGPKEKGQLRCVRKVIRKVFSPSCRFPAGVQKMCPENGRSREEFP